MFESPRSLWQHFAVAIVAVLVIMSLSSVNANNENDQCMLSGKTRTEKPCTGRLYQLSEALSRVAGLPVNSHVCRRHWDELRKKDVRCSCPTHDRKTPSRLDSSQFLTDITQYLTRLALERQHIARAHGGVITAKHELINSSRVILSLLSNHEKSQSR